MLGFKERKRRLYKKIRVKGSILERRERKCLERETFLLGTSYQFNLNNLK